MQDPEIDENESAESGVMPFWKKLLVALSLASMAIGGGMKAWGAVRSPDQPSEVSTDGAEGAAAGESGVAPNGLVALPPIAGSETPGEAAPSEEPDLSPVFLRLGFGFFVGFCIGFALRAFFRISAIALGVVLLSIFGLQYAGVLDVQWGVIEGHWDGVVARISQESKSFFAFVTGSLPTAGLASLGLVTGFKKN